MPDSPTVTAVVCSFWRERRGNVVRIVNDLRHGSVVPDHIIALDNNPESPDHFTALKEVDPRISCVEGHNWETRGKFVAALLAPADYYLMADDDTSVGPRTIECLLRYAHRGFVTGYWGVKLGHDKRMSGGTVIGPGGVDQPFPVDCFHGRVMFMAHDALVRTLAAEEGIRTAGGDFGNTGDDIICGLANPEGSVIVPMRGDECFVDLPDGGVAMQHREHYFAERDRFSVFAADHIARTGVPKW